MHIQTIHIYGVANDSKKIGGKKGRVDLEGNNNWLRIRELQCYHFFFFCNVLSCLRVSISFIARIA